MIDKCKSESSLIILNDFLNGIFNFNTKYGIDKNSKQLITEIIKISNENSSNIFKKF